MRTRLISSVLLCVAVGFLTMTMASADESTPQPSTAEPPQKEPPVKSNSVAPNAERGWSTVPFPRAVHKGLKWLVINQCQDGGWGPEAGGQKTQMLRSNSKARQSRRYTDVGNTAFAVLALMDSGSLPNRGVFQGPVRRGVEFIVKSVEKSPTKGMSVTETSGTQIQSKIGRYADTFLAARVLTRADRHMRTEKENARVRKALRKTLRKIQEGQQEDGSWNTAGWAPIHSTAYASQALWAAKQKGLGVSSEVLKKVERYTVREMKLALRTPTPPARKRGAPAPVVTPPSVKSGAAGVLLYSLSQGIEQLTRTAVMRRKHNLQVKKISKRVNDPGVLAGLGSMGGEEFISYTNINLAMARIGGKDAKRWNESIKNRLAAIQNADGSWVGHHCITGRTAVTSLALSAMLAERSVQYKKD